MDMELSMSAEERLQYSLDTLRDAVIKQQTVTQPPGAAESCTSHSCFLSFLRFADTATVEFISLPTASTLPAKI